MLSLSKYEGRRARNSDSTVSAQRPLHEVEAVATHVAIMNKGMLLAEGTLGQIQQELKDYAFTLQVRCADPRALTKELVQRDHVVSVAFDDADGVSISSSSSRALTEEFPGLALALGIEVFEFSCPGEDLEALFERLMR